MAAQMSTTGPIRSYSCYLRSAQGRFPLPPYLHVGKKPPRANSCKNHKKVELFLQNQSSRLAKNIQNKRKGASIGQLYTTLFNSKWYNLHFYSFHGTSGEEV